MNSSEIETSHLYPSQVSPCLPMATSQEQHTVKTMNVGAPEPPWWPPRYCPGSPSICPPLSPRASITQQARIHSFIACQTLSHVAGHEAVCRSSQPSWGKVGRERQHGSMWTEGLPGPGELRAHPVSHTPPLLGRPSSWSRLGGTPGKKQRGTVLDTGLKRGQFQGLPSEASPCP